MIKMKGNTTRVNLHLTEYKTIYMIKIDFAWSIGVSKFFNHNFLGDVFLEIVTDEIEWVNGKGPRCKYKLASTKCTPASVSMMNVN